MSFTDLASLAQARQQQQQPPPPPPPQPQQNEANAPPDPRSFTQSPTNPVAAVQTASIDASGGAPAGLESNEDLGDVAKTKDKTAAAEPAADEAATDTYPPVAFAPENYRAPAADAGYAAWGKKPPEVAMAEQYPGVYSSRDMPTPVRSYPEARDTGAALAQWGPPAVAEPAGQASFLLAPFAPILDAMSQGKFSRNFTVSALRGLEIRREQAVEKIQQANELHSQILGSYSSILAHAADGTLTHDQARRQIEDYALSIGDESVLSELRRNDLRGVEHWLNYQHALHVRLQRAGTQLGKLSRASANSTEKEQGVFDALGGRSGVSGGGGASADGGIVGVNPNALPGPEGPQTPPAPPAADQGEPLNPYEQKIITDLRDANGQPLTPQMASAVVRTAQRRMMGDPDEIRGIPAGSLADRAIGQAQMALGANIDRIAKLKPSPNEDPDEFRQKQLEAIKQNNPAVAQQVDDLKNLRIDPQTFSQAGGQRRRAVDLTAQLYPNWNQGMYHAFQNVWNNGNSQENRQLEAGNRATTQAVILEAAINRLNIAEDSTIPNNVWNDWKTHGYTSNPQFAALNEPLRAFAGEMVFLQTGRVNVTPVTQFLKEVPLYSGKAALRTVVRQAMIGGLHTMEQKGGVFARQTGLSGLPPAADPDAMMLYDEFARSNPNTGAFHKDAPPELKSIEPSAEDRKHRPTWMTKDQQFEPMGKGEWQKLRATIEKLRKDNPSDPRLPQLMHEYGIAQ